MAIQDCTRFLGRRVSYTISHPTEGIVSFTGRILSVTHFAEGYEPPKGYSQLLFQEDDFEGDPDYISTEHDFHIIE